MSHEVLITRGQSIFNFFANPGRGRPQHPRQPAPASTGLLRPASAWICKKIKNALSSGYQDLMGHLILTTSPWSVLTWITLFALPALHWLQFALEQGNFFFMTRGDTLNTFIVHAIDASSPALLAWPQVKGWDYLSSRVINRVHVKS